MDVARDGQFCCALKWRAVVIENSQQGLTGGDAQVGHSLNEIGIVVVASYACQRTQVAPVNEDRDLHK